MRTEDAHKAHRHDTTRGTTIIITKPMSTHTRTLTMAIVTNYETHSTHTYTQDALKCGPLSSWSPQLRKRALAWPTKCLVFASVPLLQHKLPLAAFVGSLGERNETWIYVHFAMSCSGQPASMRHSEYYLNTHTHTEQNDASSLLHLFVVRVSGASSSAMARCMSMPQGSHPNIPFAPPHSRGIFTLL